jgi:hypothetical protein
MIDKTTVRYGISEREEYEWCGGICHSHYCERDIHKPLDELNC